MQYLQRLIEAERKRADLESEIGRWEATPELALQITKDGERLEQWLFKGKSLEESVFNSELDSCQKTELMQRLNKSYCLLPNRSQSSSNLTYFASGLGMGFGLGVLASYAAGKVKERFEEKIMETVYKEVNHAV